MGQYWMPVNLTKGEFIAPHQLGTGLKLWEQMASGYIGSALVILLAAMPCARGGGDLGEDPIIGRWAGDRVVFIGDYSEDDDFQMLEGEPSFGSLYASLEETFTDITPQVAAVIERELRGKFVGNGWKTFKENEDA